MLLVDPLTLSTSQIDQITSRPESSNVRYPRLATFLRHTILLAISIAHSGSENAMYFESLPMRRQCCKVANVTMVLNIRTLFSF